MLFHQTSRAKYLHFLWGWVCITYSAATSKTDGHGDYDGSDLIDWINTHPQGYVHPSVRIGREVPGDKSSIIGLFVRSEDETKPIEEDEVIATIPWERIIGPNDDEYDFETFESCEAIRNLATELKLGEKSKYAPYVRYLLTQSIETMPGEWTEAGQELLQQIIGEDELPPSKEDWFEGAQYMNRWIYGCGGNPNDRMERLAFYLSASRDEDTLMVPVYDMTNHSNDPKKLNTRYYKPQEVGDSFVIRASRRINPSEAILISYNKCHPCTEDRNECKILSYYGTPTILSRFGFVESLPHYWTFESTMGDGQRMDFCLDENETTDELNVSWLNSVPSDEDIAWFATQLDRLKEIANRREMLEKQLVRPDEKDRSLRRKMPRVEWDMCWNYHGALMAAVEAAVSSLDLKENSLA